MINVEKLTNLTAMKLLRLGYVLLSCAGAILGLFVAVWADYFSPNTYGYWIPIVFLSFVSGVLTAAYWLLRLLWLFVACNPRLAPVSQHQLDVAFNYLAIIASFELLSYIKLYWHFGH